MNNKSTDQPSLASSDKPILEFTFPSQESTYCGSGIPPNLFSVAEDYIDQNLICKTLSPFYQYVYWQFEVYSDLSPGSAALLNLCIDNQVVGQVMIGDRNKARIWSIRCGYILPKEIREHLCEVVNVSIVLQTSVPYLCSSIAISSIGSLFFCQTETDLKSITQPIPPYIPYTKLL